MKKNVVVGVCGGIAVYKTCMLVSMLRKNGYNVDVIMTENATKFVAPLTFETLSNNPVTCEMFKRERPWETEHISLAKKADIFVIAPATANVISKLACGIADDMLTTTLLAVKCPILLAPAMNTAMLNNEIIQKNIGALKERGMKFISSQKGFLACGDIGDGRMAEPENIFDRIKEELYFNKDLVGKKALVALGGTSENIDGVRFITNKSSGKMGVALIEELDKRGAEVTAVCGSISVDFPNNVKRINVGTTQNMYDEMMSRVMENDYILMPSAPADYRPKDIYTHKIKDEKLTIEFVKNVDIAKSIGEIKEDRKLVVFCVETQNLKENARNKLMNKNADMIVANDVTKEGAGFSCDTNIVTIIDKNGEQDYDLMQKSQVANEIINRLIKL